MLKIINKSLIKLMKLAHWLLERRYKCEKFTDDMRLENLNNTTIFEYDQYQK